MANQLTDKVFYTANQSILIPLKAVLPIAIVSIKFGTIETIFITTVNDYLKKRGYNKTDTTTQINRGITISRNEL